MTTIIQCNDTITRALSLLVQQVMNKATTTLLVERNPGGSGFKPHVFLDIGMKKFSTHNRAAVHFRVLVAMKFGEESEHVLTLSATVTEVMHDGEGVLKLSVVAVETGCVLIEHILDPHDEINYGIADAYAGDILKALDEAVAKRIGASLYVS